MGGHARMDSASGSEQYAKQKGCQTTNEISVGLERKVQETTSQLFIRNHQLLHQLLLIGSTTVYELLHLPVMALLLLVIDLRQLVKFLLRALREKSWISCFLKKKLIILLVLLVFGEKFLVLG